MIGVSLVPLALFFFFVSKRISVEKDMPDREKGLVEKGALPVSAASIRSRHFPRHLFSFPCRPRTVRPPFSLSLGKRRVSPNHRAQLFKGWLREFDAHLAVATFSFFFFSFVISARARFRIGFGSFSPWTFQKNSVCRHFFAASFRVLVRPNKREREREREGHKQKRKGKKDLNTPRQGRARCARAGKKT